MKTLVVGYGNPTRGDDGVGVCVAEALEKEGLADVEVRSYQQLHVDLVSEFSNYELIILVDASEDGPEVELRKIQASLHGHMASSHHLDPALLLRLSQITRLGEPELYLCAVRGENFGFGEQLSTSTVDRVRLAVEEVKFLIERRRVAYARS